MSDESFPIKTVWYVGSNGPYKIRVQTKVDRDLTWVRYPDDKHDSDRWVIGPAAEYVFDTEREALEAYLKGLREERDRRVEELDQTILHAETRLRDYVDEPPEEPQFVYEVTYQALQTVKQIVQVKAPNLVEAKKLAWDQLKLKSGEWTPVRDDNPEKLTWVSTRREG